MIKLKIKDIEKKFKVLLKRNTIALGLDTATKTGYCISRTDEIYLYLDIGFINLDIKGITDREMKNALRYEELFNRFKSLIKKEYILVVEDVFFGRNAQTLILLSRIGAIAWTIGRFKNCQEIIWRTAVQARKVLGLPCNQKKEVVAKRVNKILKTKLTNPDEIDAIVLAIGGLINE